MAFYGCDFKYNSFSCSSLGLEVYNFDSTGQDDESDFLAQGDVISDSIVGKDSIYLYGEEQKGTLSPHLVFGVNQNRLNNNRWLTRREIEKIAEWLTADGNWHWLSIKQEDMIEYRYKVVLSSLKLLHSGMYPYAFEAEFTADSAYAYTYPKNYTWLPGDNIFNNRSSNRTYYRPVLLISLSSGGDFSIVNNSDGGREFKFTDLPESVTDIRVDNENQIITDLINGLNLYEYFNYNFFRAVKGKNDLTIKGDGKVIAKCEFPVNIGT